jgi:glucose-6-phosphate isomerase
MQETTTPVTQRRACKELVAHHQKIRELHLHKLFVDDPTRGKRMTVDTVGLFLDQ